MRFRRFRYVPVALGAVLWEQLGTWHDGGIAELIAVAQHTDPRNVWVWFLLPASSGNCERHLEALKQAGAVS